MHDTGRIKRQLDTELRDLVFKTPTPKELGEELGYVAKVDQAHVVMLAEQGIISGEDAGRLLREVMALVANGFAPLVGAEPSRGLYLLYEGYLIARTGAHVGGMLQAGRSRNDLGATISRLKARPLLLSCVERCIALISALETRAEDVGLAVMPGYTHYQPAVPITLAHYLLAIADALTRDLDGLVQAGKWLDACPLGAGAGGGTSYPISQETTARLLGFAGPICNSIDAVATRDHVLRQLAAAAILGLTLSRLSADILLWSTVEFALIRLPDELVGSSSMMPQKRNPFLLEHVKGRSTSPLACLQHSMMAAHAVPYGNSVAVGTESVRGFEEAMEDIRSCLLILEKHILLMEPDTVRMEAAARVSHTTATLSAETLARSSGRSYREAHHEIGRLISAAEVLDAQGPGEAADAASYTNGKTRLERVTPSMAASAAKYGGGPGAAQPNEGKERCAFAREFVDEKTSRWVVADRILRERVSQLVSSAPY